MREVKMLESFRVEVGPIRSLRYASSDGRHGSALCHALFLGGVAVATDGRVLLMEEVECSGDVDLFSRSCFSVDPDGVARLRKAGSSVLEVSFPDWSVEGQKEELPCVSVDGRVSRSLSVDFRDYPSVGQLLQVVVDRGLSGCVTVGLSHRVLKDLMGKGEALRLFMRPAKESLVVTDAVQASVFDDRSSGGGSGRRVAGLLMPMGITDAREAIEEEYRWSMSPLYRRVMRGLELGMGLHPEEAWKDETEEATEESKGECFVSEA